MSIEVWKMVLPSFEVFWESTYTVFNTDLNFLKSEIDWLFLENSVKAVIVLVELVFIWYGMDNLRASVQIYDSPWVALQYIQDWLHFR